MARTSITRLLPLLFLVSLANGAAETLPGDLRFDHLRISDGLSSSSISSIVQDADGFIWFGTQSGLNRYDGYTVERFEHDPFDRNSLSHNLIQTMHLDESGIFWIGTYGGLNRFDPEDKSFTLYESSPTDPGTLSNNVVVAVNHDADGALWVGTLGGLNRLDPDTGRFAYYLPDEGPGSLPNEVVRSVELDRRGRLWIGTYGGLSRYVPERDSFETITTEGPSGTRLPSPYVMSIVLDPDDDEVLWLGTWNGGVSRYDTRTGEIGTITLPSNDVYAMMFDRHGRLWVGTWGGGLAIVDVRTREVRTIQAGDEARPAGISHDVVYSFLEDASGIVWIGTNGGGVNAYVPWENRFETFENDPGNPNSIGAGKVEVIWIDTDETVWFGTYNGGLTRFEPGAGSYRRYAFDETDPRSLSNNIVNAILRDSRGTLWIGTNEGLNRYDPARDGFQRILARDGDLPEDTVFEIHEAPDGRLWLGTNTSGIVVYDPATGAYDQLAHDPADPTSLSDDLVRSIVRDNRGVTWVGTNDGLNRYDEATGGFIRHLHDTDDAGTIPSNNIRAVFQDSRGTLWIATTGGGVTAYDYDTDRFSLLSTRDGLASHHVVGIQEGRPGELWFATNRGISVYAPETGEMRTLTASNGLLSNELTQAVARDRAGRLYFGSVKGVTVVDPRSQDGDGYAPPIVITRLEVLGVPRPVTRDAAGDYAPVELRHSDRFFAVEYAALDYSTPSQNIYAYMLEGFDTEWQLAGIRNYAGYTNLTPGEYTLRIRGAGSRGNWNDAGIRLPIVVRPPWWSATPARIGYTVVGLAVLAGAYVAVARRQRLAQRRIDEQARINEELELKVTERTAEIERARTLAERATQEKSLFLANMSHEIRTPLTGMTGMMSLLENTRLDQRQLEYVRYLRTSAENLTTLVNDLLDFERIEAGELRLVSEPFSIAETVRYIEELFTPAAEEKGLTLTVELDDSTAIGWVGGDRSRVVQVLTNLVSNAVKYTHEGSVTVRASRVDEGTHQGRYRFEVADSGIGLDPQEQPLVFERFRQLDNGYSKSARGVGLGLAIVRQVVDSMGGTIEVRSARGSGSRFIVTLPFEPVEEPAASGTIGAGAGQSTRGSDSAALGPPAPQAEAETSGTAGPPAAAPPAPMSILVCEDEAINRLYLKTHLAAQGYSVQTATDGTQAVELATTGEIDLVLMDLGMPGISGLEATERIRNAERENGRPRVPIVALTAHTYPEDVERCRRAGMDGFVAKPIREADLDAALIEHLSR